MTITFLGTGASQGVPMATCQCSVCTSLDLRDQRLRSAIHLNINHQSIIIDAGPDFRQQVLRAQIQNIDAVLFTHSHQDHTGGVDDIKAFTFIQQKKIPLYGNQDVIAHLKKNYDYLFDNPFYAKRPQLKVLDNKPFPLAGITILPIKAYHYQLPIFGFRIGNFTYITDASHIPDQEIEKIKGSTILVINALQQAHHIAHFNLAEAITLAQRVKAKTTYFTHISHQLGLHRQVAKTLPTDIALAYDGLKIDL